MVALLSLEEQRVLEPWGERASREALPFLVLERELDLRAVKDHLIVVDGHVELLDLRDP
jgi:hypothetical protein